MARERPILFSGPMVRALLADAKEQTRRAVAPQPKPDGKGPGWSWDHHKDCSQLYLGRPNREQMLVHAPWRPGDVLYVREAWRVGTETGRGGAPCLEYRADGARRQADEFTPEQILWLGEAWTGDPAVMLVPGVYADDRLRWRPGIHLPSWGSRLRREVTGVRVERVQDISEEDAVAEGSCVRHTYAEPEASREVMAHGEFLPGLAGARACFAKAWDGLNAKPRPILQDGRVVAYVSYPWAEVADRERTYRGKPWMVQGNPFVWVVTFRRLQA